MYYPREFFECIWSVYFWSVHSKNSFITLENVKCIMLMNFWSILCAHATLIHIHIVCNIVCGYMAAWCLCIFLQFILCKRCVSVAVVVCLTQKYLLCAYLHGCVVCVYYFTIYFV